MTSAQIVNLVFGVALGGYCILAGAGIVRVSKNPAIQEKWKAKYGPWMILLGAIIVIGRIVGVISSIRR
jgi:hypothetical protein